MKTLVIFLGALFLFSNVSAQVGWNPQVSGTDELLTDVNFTDENNGYITGWTNTILHTTDGGGNWGPQSPPPNAAYQAIFFTDAQTGWAAGVGGKIIHTSDGGNSWDSQVSGTQLFILDLFFLDSNKGWSCGGRYEDLTVGAIQEIRHTTDAGVTWNPQQRVPDQPILHSITFIDDSTGYAVGEKGTVLKSIDGGVTWVIQMSDDLYNLYDVFFVDNMTGWVVGQDLSFDHFAVIFKTDDGGANWNMQTFGADEKLQGVWFADGSLGWAVGGSGSSGIVMHSDNGGTTWTYQEANTPNSLTSVFFADKINGWAVGYEGTIIYTNNGGIVGTDEITPSHSSNAFNLRNYPNPFHDATTITYELPENTTVSLRIYNNLGSQIDILVNEPQGKGQHQVTWNSADVPSGIYFYRLVTDRQGEIKKMTVIR